MDMKDASIPISAFGKKKRKKKEEGKRELFLFHNFLFKIALGNVSLNNKSFLYGILRLRSPVNSSNASAVNRGIIHSSPDFRKDS